MADREETLLFLVDVQVRGANALRGLDSDLDTAFAAQDRRLLSLGEAADDAAGGHQGLADAIDRVQQASGLSEERVKTTRDLADAVDRVQTASTSGPVAVPSIGGGRGPVVVPSQQMSPETALWGVRGPKNPGSRTNPIAEGLETSAAAGLGSLGMPTSPGTDAASAASQTVATVQPSPDRQWLLDAVRDVESKVIAPENDRMLQAVQAASQIRSPTGESPLLSAARAVQDLSAEPGLADAIASVQSAHTRSGQGGGQSPADLLAATAAVQRAASAPPALRGILAGAAGRMVPLADYEPPAPRRTLSAGETAGRLGVTLSRARELASTGQLPGASKEGGEWQIPEDAVLRMIAGGASGAGGGRGRPPAPPGGRGGGASGGSDGGGGSRIMRTLLGGKRNEPDSGDSPFSFANLFKGDEGRGGAFGLPGFGSIGSLGGLGLEHWILTALGLTASAGSAIGGAGLLGTAGLTQTLVGGGSDALVSKVTLDQVKTMVPLYASLAAAVKQYGADSTQAASAQAAITAQIKAVGPAAGQAELAVAKNVSTIKSLFESESEGARQQSADVMNQVVQLGISYTPLVTAAAQRNLGIINTDLKPLFAWLEGPEGIGVFDQLEDAFSRDLPTSIGAFSAGIEDFLRLMAAASQYTGGLSQDLDNLFTRKGQESTAQYAEEVQKLVGDLHEWDALLKLLGEDMGGVFKQDAGTANSIVGSLTAMLARLHDWENSTSGETSLQNIFEVHKEQILALLKVLPDLASGYGHFYMLTAPPLVHALTMIANGFTAIADIIEKIPGGADALGFGIVAAKLGILVPLVKGAAVAFGLLNDAEAKNVIVNDAEGGSGLLGGVGGKLGGTVAKDAEGAATGAGAAGAVEEGAGGVTIAAVLSKLGISGLAGKIGTASAEGVGSATLGVAGAAEGAGLDGLAGAITSAGAAVMPIAAVVTPFLAAIGGAAGLYELLHLLSGMNSATPTTYNTSSLTQLLQQKGTSALTTPASPGHPTYTDVPGRFAPAVPTEAAQPGPSVSDLGTSKAAQAALEQWIKTVSNSTAVAKMNITQLQGMEREGDALAQIFPKVSDTIDKFTLRIGQDFGTAGAVAMVMTARWNSDATAGLKTLTQTFNANFALINSQIGASSTLGQKLVATQVQNMVSDLTNGMASGKIGVAAGLAEMNTVIKQGAQDGAVSWKTEWSDMFDTLTQLYSENKLKTSTFTSDIQADYKTAADQVRGYTTSQYSKMFTELKQQQQEGWITQGQYNQKVASLNNQMVSQQQGAMSAWVSNLQAAMKASGSLTAQGMKVIAEETNKALGLFGAAQLPVPAAIAWNTYQSSGSTSSRPEGGAFATGGRVTRPMYMVGEEAPTHPEYVLATNPAYRQRNVKLWGEAGRHLGIPGFAQGGIAAGIAWANEVNAKHYPYEWGGGHLAIGVPNDGESGGPAGSATGQLGFDCSGTVSGDLHAMGLLNTPMTAAQFMSYGLPGPAPVTIYASPSHVFMSLDGHFFGTHGDSGAGWYAGSALPGFVERHPPNVGAGSQIKVPQVRGAGGLGSLINSALKKDGAAANKKVTKAMLSTMAGGQIGGGDSGTFTGGVAPGSWLTVARELAAKHGWDAAQVQDWQAVENIEDSSYSLTAQNPTSPAYGLAQFIEGAAEYAQYGGNATTIVGQLTAMANYIAQRYGNPAGALAKEHSAGHYAQGGKVGWAGAFADGGMATANGPTMALFGENGPETAVFIPHYAKGGKVSGPKHSLSTAVGAGMEHIRAGDEGIGTLSLLISQMVAEKLMPGLMNLLDPKQLADPTKKGFAQIVAVVKKSLDGMTATGALRLGQHVEASGSSVRDVKLANAAITSALNKITSSFNALQTLSGNQSSTAGALQALNPGTSLKSLGLTGAALKATGLTAAQAKALVGGGGYGAIGALDASQAAGDKADQAKLQAAYKEAVKDHNTKLQKSLLAQLSAVDGAMVQAISGSQAAIAQQIAATAQTYSDSAAAIGGNLGILQGLEGASPGSSLAALGLSPTILKALGIDPTTATGMVGNTGASGIATSATMLTAEKNPIQQELAYYASELPSLSGDARTQAITAMSGLTQQLIDIDVGIQQAVVQEVAATAQAFQNQVTQISGSLTVLQGIEGLAPGDSLANLGLSPAILQTLGIDPNSAQGLVGQSLATYQSLASSQGGSLTTQQLAGATSGIGAQNQYLGAEEVPLEQELAYYQGELPSLSGDALTQAIDAMSGVASQLLGLQSTIDANTQGLQQLTQATTQNTSATTSNTGAMTGTVSFTYQNQQYLASDTPQNWNVGS